MADRDVTIDVMARDKTSPGIDRATKKFQGLKRDVDKANRSLGDSDTSMGKATNRVAAFAKKAVSMVGKAISGAAGLASTIGGGIVTAVMAAVIAGLALQLAPAIGAAIVAGAALGVGGALLAIGVFAVKSNERIQKSFKHLAGRIGFDLRKAAQPLVGPLVDAMGKLEKLSKAIRPQLKGIFSDLAPIIPMLTDGLSGLVKELLPGLKASTPGILAAFRGMSSVLPGIGKTVGKLVKDLFANPKIIENTTRALFKLATGPLKLLGPLLSGLNVLFGAQANMAKLAGDGWGRLWPKLIGWLDGGSGAIGRMKDAWAPLWTAVQNVWDKLKLFAGATEMDDIKQKHRDLIKAIKDAWGPLKTFLGTVWTEAWNLVKAKWNEVVVPWWNGTVKPWLDREISGVIDRAFKAAKDKAVAQIKGMVKDVLKFLFPLPAAIIAALVGPMRSAGGRAGRSLVDGMVAAINAGKGRVVGAARAIASAAAAAAAAGAAAITNSGASFAAGGSWRAAEFAAGASFAAGSGTSRTGGPTPVSVTSEVNVALDGRPFRALAVTVVNAAEKRKRFRDKVGRR